MASSTGKRKKGIIFLIILGSILCCLFFVFGIPILINELYKMDAGYMTLWGASDVLSFYSVILSGLITIGVLAATIFYNNRVTEKQINLARSQVNVPFFIIEKVYLNNNQGDFDEFEDGLTWKKDYEISKYKKNCGKIFILLRNIGEGIAITPKYQIDLSVEIVGTIPKFVKKGDTWELTYDLYNVLAAKVGMDKISQDFEQFNTCVKLKYQNTSGIYFRQEITLQHTKKENNNAVELLVNSISHQYVDR